MNDNQTDVERVRCGVSSHFPPDVRERLQDAAAHPDPYWRQQRIEAAHRYATGLYPELFKPGA
jgi:hypothetical protein